MLKREALIHVGMPKTGTSSIQETFAANPCANIRYAPLPNANHSLLSAICFERAPERNRPNKLLGLDRPAAFQRRRKMLRQLSKALNQQAHQSETSAILFSGERFSNAVKSDAGVHEKMRDYLSRWCDSFRIFGYVRPLQSLLPSDFQQRIQVGRAAKLDLDWYYPNYRQKFEKFDAVYGRDRVSLRKFSRADLLQGDVVLDFAQQISADLNPADVKNTNQSLSLEGTAILFTMVRAGRIQDTNREVSEQNRKIIAALKNIKGRKLAFCSDQLVRVAEKNLSDIDWIEARIGARVFDPQPPKGVVIRREEELFEIAAETLDSKIGEALSADPDTPSPEQLASWLKSDLDKITAVSAG